MLNKKSNFDNYLEKIQILGKCLKSNPYTHIKFSDDIFNKLNLKNSYNLYEYNNTQINLFEPDKVSDLPNNKLNFIYVDIIVKNNIDITSVLYQINTKVLLVAQIDPTQNGVYLQTSNGFVRTELLEDTDTYNLGVRVKLDNFKYETYFILQNKRDIYNPDYEYDPQNPDINLSTYYYTDYYFPKVGDVLIFKSGGNFLLRTRFEYLIFDENFNFNDIINYNNRIFVIGDFGSILEQTKVDGVYSSEEYNNILPQFTKKDIEIKENLNKIFNIEEVAFIVGDNGLIVKSSNNGDTLKVLDTNISDNLYNLHFYNKDFGVVVGDSGTILTTFDSGITWIPSYLPTELVQNFYAVNIFNYSIDKYGIIIIGDNGIVLKLVLNDGVLTIPLDNPIVDISNTINPKANLKSIKYLGVSNENVNTDFYHYYLIGGENNLFVFKLNLGNNSLLESGIYPLNLIDINIPINLDITNIDAYWDNIDLRLYVYVSSKSTALTQTKVVRFLLDGIQNGFSKVVNKENFNFPIYVEKTHITNELTQLKNFCIITNDLYDSLLLCGTNRFISISSCLHKSELFKRNNTIINLRSDNNIKYIIDDTQPILSVADIIQNQINLTNFTDINYRVLYETNGFIATTSGVYDPTDNLISNHIARYLHYVGSNNLYILSDKVYHLNGTNVLPYTPAIENPICAVEYNNTLFVSDLNKVYFSDILNSNNFFTLEYKDIINIQIIDDVIYLINAFKDIIKIDLTKIFNNINDYDIEYLSKTIVNEEFILLDKPRKLLFLNTKQLDNTNKIQQYITTNGLGVYIDSNLIRKETDDISDQSKFKLCNNLVSDIFERNGEIVYLHRMGEMSIYSIETFTDNNTTLTFINYRSLQKLNIPLSYQDEGLLNKTDISEISIIFKPRLIFLDYFIGKKVQHTKKAKVILSLNYKEINTYDSNTSYNIGDLVVDGVDYYLSIKQNNTNSLSDTSSLTFQGSNLNIELLSEDDGVIFNSWDYQLNSNPLNYYLKDYQPQNKRFGIYYSNTHQNQLSINNYTQPDYSGALPTPAQIFLPKLYTETGGVPFLLTQPEGNPVRLFKNRLLVCAYGNQTTDSYLGTISGKTIRMLLYDELGNQNLYLKNGDMIRIQIDRDNRFDSSIYQSQDINPDTNTTLYDSINLINGIFNDTTLTWGNLSLSWQDAGLRTIDLYYPLPNEIVRLINDYKGAVKVKITNISRFGFVDKAISGLKQTIEDHPIIGKLYTPTILRRPKVLAKNYQTELLDYILIESKFNSYNNLSAKLEFNSNNIQEENYNNIANGLGLSDSLKIDNEGIVYQFNTIYGSDYNLYGFLNKTNTIYDENYLFRNNHKNNILSNNNTSRILPNFYNLLFNDPTETVTGDFTINENSLIFNIIEESNKGISYDDYNKIIIGTFFKVRKVSDNIFLNQAAYVSNKEIVDINGTKSAKIDFKVINIPFLNAPLTEKTHYHIIDKNDSVLSPIVYFTNTPTIYFGIPEYGYWLETASYDIILDLTLVQISELLEVSNRNIINMDGYARVLTNDYNISREFSAIYYTNNNNDLALNILEYLENDPSIYYSAEELVNKDDNTISLIKSGEYFKTINLEEFLYNKTLYKTLDYENVNITLADNSIIMNYDNQYKEILIDGVINDIEIVEANKKHIFLFIATNNGLLQYQLYNNNALVITTDVGVTYRNQNINTNIDIIPNDSLLNIDDKLLIGTDNGIYVEGDYLLTGFVINKLIKYSNFIFVATNSGVFLYDQISFNMISSDVVNNFILSEHYLSLKTNSSIKIVYLNTIKVGNNPIIDTISVIMDYYGFDSSNNIWGIYNGNIYKILFNGTTILQNIQFIQRNSPSIDTIENITNYNFLFVDSYDRILIGGEKIFLLNIRDSVYGSVFTRQNTRTITLSTAEERVLISFPNPTEYTIISNNDPKYFKDTNGVYLVYSNGLNKVNGLLYEVKNMIELNNGVFVFSADIGLVYLRPIDSITGQLELLYENNLNTNNGLDDGIISDVIKTIQIENLQTYDLIPYYENKPLNYPLSNFYIDFHLKKFNEGKLKLIGFNNIEKTNISKLKFTNINSKNSSNKILWITTTDNGVTELLRMLLNNDFEWIPQLEETNQIGSPTQYKSIKSFPINLNENPLDYSNELSIIGLPVLNNLNSNKTLISRLNLDLDGIANNNTYRKDFSNTINDDNFKVNFNDFIDLNRIYEVTNIEAIETGYFYNGETMDLLAAQNSARPTQYLKYNGSNYEYVYNTTYNNNIDQTLSVLDRSNSQILNILNTYDMYDVVSLSGVTYRSKTNNNIALQPNLNPNDWLVVVPTIFGITEPNTDIILNYNTWDYNNQIIYSLDPVNDIRTNIVLLAVSVKSGKNERVILMSWDESNLVFPENNVDELNRNICLGKYFLSNELVDGNIGYLDITDGIHIDGNIKSLQLTPEQNKYVLTIGSIGKENGIHQIKFNPINSVLNYTKTIFDGIEDNLLGKNVYASIYETNKPLSEYSSELYYIEGDKVIYNNTSYIKTNDNQSIPTTISDWDLYNEDYINNLLFATSYGIEILDKNNFISNVVKIEALTDINFNSYTTINSILIPIGTKLSIDSNLSLSYSLVNGLTYNTLVAKYSWILSANLENAYIGESNHPETGELTLILFNGVLKCGVLLDGVLCSGELRDGTLMDGTWGTYLTEKLGSSYKVNLNTPQNTSYRYLSKWRNGKLVKGLWKNGELLNGCWLKGEHENGLWLNGILSDGLLSNGVLQGGNLCTGRFINGTINEESASTIWHSGFFLGGDFDQGNWISGVFDQRINKATFGFKSTKKNPAILHSGELLNGEMGGDNQFTHFMSGVLRGGLHHSGTWHLGLFDGGTWLSGVLKGYVNVAKIDGKINVDIKNKYSNFGDVGEFNSLPVDANENSDSETSRLLRFHLDEPSFMQPNDDFLISGNIKTNVIELNNPSNNKIYNLKANKNYTPLKYGTLLANETNDYNLTGYVSKSIVEFENKIYIYRGQNNTNSSVNPIESIANEVENSVLSNQINLLGYNGLAKKHKVDLTYNYDKFLTYTENNTFKFKGLISPYTGSYNFVSDFNCLDRSSSSNTLGSKFCSIGHIKEIYEDMVILAEFRSGEFNGGILLNGVKTGGNINAGYIKHIINIDGGIG